jgi:hypothetical protein
LIETITTLNQFETDSCYEQFLRLDIDLMLIKAKGGDQRYSRANNNDNVIQIPKILPK